MVLELALTWRSVRALPLFLSHGPTSKWCSVFLMMFFRCCSTISQAISCGAPIEMLFVQNHPIIRQRSSPDSGSREDALERLSQGSKMASSICSSDYWELSEDVLSILQNYYQSFCNQIKGAMRSQTTKRGQSQEMALILRSLLNFAYSFICFRLVENRQGKVSQMPSNYGFLMLDGMVRIIVTFGSEAIIFANHIRIIFWYIEVLRLALGFWPYEISPLPIRRVVSYGILIMSQADGKWISRAAINVHFKNGIYPSHYWRYKMHNQ